MTKFEAGKTYSTRSICDNDCVISVSIEKRTAKTITTTVHGQSKTFRIGECDGAEMIRPWGTYSMCPMITAND